MYVCRVHCLAIIVNLDNNNRKAFRSARTAYHFKMKKDAMLAHIYYLCCAHKPGPFSRWCPSMLLCSGVIFCHVNCCLSKHAACDTCALFSFLFFFDTLLLLSGSQRSDGTDWLKQFFYCSPCMNGSRCVCVLCCGVSCVGIYFICSTFVIFAMAPFITCILYHNWLGTMVPSFVTQVAKTWASTHFSWI